jgi:hypothetical protein
MTATMTSRRRGSVKSGETDVPARSPRKPCSSPAAGADNATELPAAESVELKAPDCLTAASALALITRLIAEVPGATAEKLDRIKLVDKLINTARAMMETRLKTEEAAAISARIDELENRIEKMTHARKPGV